jgi:hypothetical protein
MSQTFRALCPEAKLLHVFEIVSEQKRTVGWCTQCRKTWPLTELSDGETDEAAVRKPAKKGRPAKKRPA